MISSVEILQKYWKHASFREPQEQIINKILAGKNVVALLPTGGGKSICYQVPSMMREGVGIVISPLIALMQDQVSNLTSKGIKAVALTSSLTQNEIINTFDNLKFGNYKFLYLSPEKLQSEFIQSKISELNVNLIAIDEAHCISEWGHDFRPSYRNITVLKEIHPKVPIIALTASATAIVLKDIVENLKLQDALVFKKSLNRKNLSYIIHRTEDIYYHVKLLVSKAKSSVIIYANNRKATKNLSAFLNSNGYKSGYYHGGLSANEKLEAYNDWLSEKTPVIVATSAFGMGIDKNNVSTIIHINLPLSLEDYVQQSGRAGRNDEKSSSTILFNDATILGYKNQFERARVSIEFIKKVYSYLNQYFQVPKGEKPLEKFQFNHHNFCAEYKLDKYKSFNAINILSLEEVILLDDNFKRKSTLKFNANHTEVLNYCNTNKNSSDLIKLLLRSYGGIFDSTQKIDEYILSKKLDNTVSTIISLLKKVKTDGLIQYNPSTVDSFIQFLVPREDNYTINNIAKSIKQRADIKLEKAQAVLKYMSNTKQCRSKLLLSYFNDYEADVCGICDVCLEAQNKSKHVNSKVILENILLLLEKHKQLTSREIVNYMNTDKNIVLKILQQLLEKNKIAITSQNKFERINND